MTLSLEMEQFSKKIDAYIKEQLQENTSNLFDPCYHYIKAGGKRFRPFIIYQSYKLFDDSTDSMHTILPIASAMEILHNFTLIHDDIMDNDKTRRGVDAVHVKWGIPKAILAGDILLGMVAHLVSGSDFEYEIKNQINKELSISTIEVCEGQSKDIEFEDREDVSIEAYIDMIKSKTSILFEKSSQIGGLAGKASKEHIKALQSYGQNLGIAFQIIDDILGITAIEEELGKPVGSDIARGKKTYLVINTIDQLKEKDRKEFLSILACEQISNEQQQRAIDFIINTESLEKAKQIALEHKNKAVEAIDIFPGSDTKKILLQIADLLVNRKK